MQNQSDISNDTCLQRQSGKFLYGESEEIHVNMQAAILTRLCAINHFRSHVRRRTKLCMAEMMGGGGCRFCVVWSRSANEGPDLNEGRESGMLTYMLILCLDNKTAATLGRLRTLSGAKPGQR